ncbi:hypothetical protein [Mycolicibacterium llatzerense]|nr:hypothetical protein [Mycolicibacterium llatzerense]
MPISLAPSAIHNTSASELSGQFLGPGDFISALAGTASAVSFVMSGVVFS